MGHLPNEIIANIITHFAAILSSSNSHDSDSDSRPFTLAPYATVSRAWQQRVEAARCVSDIEDLEARKRRRCVSPVRLNDIFERRYESSYLDLRPAAGMSVRDEAEALPELHCIQRFHVQATAGPQLRYFAPRALCLVASRMPGLERMHWELCDNEKRDVALRKRLRADFAHTLQILPSSLRHFDLVYDRYPPLDHSFQTPNILDETDPSNNDKLSLALCKLSQRLAVFDLRADVGPEIFWPLESTAPEHHHHHLQQQHQDDDPLWPTMCYYNINPGFIAPSGRWRFERLPDSDSDSDDDGSDWSVSSSVVPGNEKEDPFRALLDLDAANAILLAAARAARRMPALQTMEFMLDPPIWRDNGRLEVVYTTVAGTARGGTPLAPPGGGGATAELLVESHPLFQPDEEVMQAWREAAEEHSGAVSGLVVVVRGHMPW